jgi:hypothetical protein
VEEDFLNEIFKQISQIFSIDRFIMTASKAQYALSEWQKVTDWVRSATEQNEQTDLYREKRDWASVYDDELRGRLGYVRMKCVTY